MNSVNVSLDKKPPQSSIVEVLLSFRKAFIAVGLFSGVINLLMLTGSLFMLQVYDRILSSHSIPTLIALVILVAVLYVFQGLMDAIRGRLLVRIGRSLDERLTDRVYQTIIRLPLRVKTKSDGLQAIRDLDQLRSFLSSTGPTALFDFPWMPLYLGLCFIFHIWIGVTALAGALILIALTLATEFLTRAPTQMAAGLSAERLAFAETSRRNAEVLEAMGMAGRFSARWVEANTKYMGAQQRATDIASSLGAASRVFRLLLQSLVLAVGAYLVIKQEATAGIIIASSILVSRALAPVELAIANWRGFVAARQGWNRLANLISQLEQAPPTLDLPRPSKNLAVENIMVVPPGGQRPVVQEMSFRLDAGQGLGIIGPSASGKSSLVRAIVGVWQPVRGKIRLDGAALDQWSMQALGSHIGYLPQDVELFDGTIAENISRFVQDPNPEMIIAAARSAGVHDLILRLPNGYETKIGESGSVLSAGQRQRIGLARALYGDPFLVVLDEPNSNLDSEGDEALSKAVTSVRERNAIVIVIAHRPSALKGIDLVLAMAGGRSQAFGPKEDVLRRVLQRPTPDMRMTTAAIEGGGKLA